MKKTLGGDRLGSGSKIQVDLHGYERSTHDMGYLWRSTMAAGTLVPFLNEVALPGDTFDINLDCDIKTHPTIGPLFASYKVQLDIFQAPIRLYQGQLHNNKLGIGMNMATVKLPVIILTATEVIESEETDYDNAQINPSSILSYLGIRGVGMIGPAEPNPQRIFNGISFLAYWDTYKNYYANKQEEIGFVIHTTVVANVETVDTIELDGNAIGESPAETPMWVNAASEIEIAYTGATPILTQIMLNTSQGIINMAQALIGRTDGAGTISGFYNFPILGPRQIINWRYVLPTEITVAPPELVQFPLENIDKMREKILAATETPTAFVVNDTGLTPYVYAISSETYERTMLQTQEGLGIKTYQSDLFNNWLSTEWIDGPGGISEVTAIDTSGGSFTIDTLTLSKKVYDMLNRIAVSGGTYDDWLDAVYTHDRYTKAESPIYHGGLIKELVFQEVVSNSESSGPETATQPLGTLAGKGQLSKKHKGGQVTIKIDEPSYIMGIISITPRIDYSQGNKWDTHMETMDDLHKPALDEIGFQELITEQMAWWTTKRVGEAWVTKSAGKQPAWINYMTNVNQTRGNFAIKDNEMFMTLNRRYEWEEDDIKDLTTYIDPVKYNQIFAQTSLDAQNFWTQIAIDMTVRRKMSAKIMPNL